MTSLRTNLLAVAAMALAAVAVAAAAGAASVTTQTADVFGQGPGGPVVADDGATLERSDNGISVKLRMPTPDPGSYTYPPGNAFLPAAIEGSPEAYTLWVFVFNRPDLCSVPCDGNDIGTATPAQGGVYNAAGHVAGGPNLSLEGHVSADSTSFSGSMLLEPRTADVHLAVAPHGKLIPELLPDQITKPIGNPDFWWIAILES
ncbi:MAG: hypothetical protein ACRDOF_11095 [Gaiellaceae bacterium]